MVIYSTYGGYLPALSLWHSQANEGMLAHVPGIRIAIPSTPEDAAGLFWAAFHDNDPSLILIPKKVRLNKGKVDKFSAVPFGKGVVRQEGTDVTLVTWGNCVELAMQAAQKMQETGVSVEIIDLRTIVPCDWDLIEESLKKTGRLVVVHEDKYTTGFGSTIISRFACDKEKFYYLESPPQLVAGDDVHIAYHLDLELAVLPSVEKIISAINVVSSA